jgi:hypothetical protein
MGNGPSTYTLGNANAVSTSLTGLVQGTYLFQLMVTITTELRHDTVSITVNAAPPPPNVPPVANAGADRSITLPTNSITLNGTASSMQMEPLLHIHGQKSADLLHIP